MQKDLKYGVIAHLEIGRDKIALFLKVGILKLELDGAEAGHHLCCHILRSRPVSDIPTMPLAGRRGTSA